MRAWKFISHILFQKAHFKKVKRIQRNSVKIMQQGELHEIESHVKVGHDAAAVWKKQKNVT